MEKMSLERRFDRFAKATWSNAALEPKTTLLLHLGAAIAVGCYP